MPWISSCLQWLLHAAQSLDRLRPGWSAALLQTLVALPCRLRWHLYTGLLHPAIASLAQPCSVLSIRQLTCRASYMRASFKGAGLRADQNAYSILIRLLLAPYCCHTVSVTKPEQPASCSSGRQTICVVAVRCCAALLPWYIRAQDAIDVTGRLTYCQPL